MSYSNNDATVAWRDVRHFVNSISWVYLLTRMCWKDIDPDSDSSSFSSYGPSNACQSKSRRNNSGDVPLSEKYWTRPSLPAFWKRKLFSFCRDCWSAVTKCPRNTCSWRTSCTTWGTTPAIRSFNADVTTTFSSFGCNGAPRYNNPLYCRGKPLFLATRRFFILRRAYVSIVLWFKALHRSKSVILLSGYWGFREAYGSIDGTFRVHG